MGGSEIITTELLKHRLSCRYKDERTLSQQELIFFTKQPMQLIQNERNSIRISSCGPFRQHVALINALDFALKNLSSKRRHSLIATKYSIVEIGKGSVFIQFRDKIRSQVVVLATIPYRHITTTIVV